MPFKALWKTRSHLSAECMDVFNKT